MLPSQFPVANRLLAAMARLDYQRLALDLEPVELTVGQELHQADQPIHHVYFASDALVSLLTRAGDHSTLAVGLVGNEGVVGVATALGVKSSPIRTLVQVPGSALRMQTAVFVWEFQQNALLRQAVLGYVHTLTLQIAQTAACNRFHVIEARLARWLLMTRDRLSSDYLHLTHEFLGYLLGVRRAGVSTAAQALKERGLIDYSRGNIEIVDGPGLETASCLCYAMDRKHRHLS
jgi:CRP-like cAMP-binding protein